MNFFGKIYITLRKNGKLLKLSNEFSKILKYNLEKHGKRATGDLINSIHTGVTLQEENLVFNLKANYYLTYVDSGRRPGSYPNLDSLKKWMNLKGIPEYALFPIANKIKKKGIKPTNVMQETIGDIFEGDTINQLEKYISEGINDIIVEQINLKRN